MMITLYIADKSACLQVPTYSYGQFYEAMPSQGCYLTDNTHWESWLRELASQSCNWMRPSPQQSVEIQQQQFESLSSSSSFQQQQSTVTSSSTQQVLNGSFEVSQTGGESTEPSGKLEVVLKKKKKPMKDCLSKPLEQSALNSFGSVLVPLKWQWLCSTNCELPTECISLCSEMPGLSNEDHLTRIRSLFAFAKTWQELLANKARLVCLFGIFAFIWTGGSFGFAEYRHLKTKTRSSGISEIILFWTKNNLEWLHWKFWRNIHVWSYNQMWEKLALWLFFLLHEPSLWYFGQIHGANDSIDLTVYQPIDPSMTWVMQVLLIMIMLHSAHMMYIVTQSWSQLLNLSQTFINIQEQWHNGICSGRCVDCLCPK